MTRGILIVSHIEEIGLGVKRLLEQVAKDVPIVVAAGLDNHEVGTDFNKISEAVSESEADYFYAFYDLGSAKMNLDMASEFSDKTIDIQTVSFVEGAYSAAALLQADVDDEEIKKQLKELAINK